MMAVMIRRGNNFAYLSLVVLALVSITSLFAMHRISFCQNDFLKKQLASKVHLSALVLREQAGNQTRDILYPNLCGKDIDSQLPNIRAMRNSEYRVPYYPVTDNTFTLVILTHERDELLRKALKVTVNLTHSTPLLCSVSATSWVILPLKASWSSAK